MWALKRGVAFAAIQFAALVAVEAAQGQDAPCIPGNTGACVMAPPAGGGKPPTAPVPLTFTTFDNPDAAYTGSTSLIDISGIPDFTFPVTSITDGVLTVSLSSSHEKRSVPNSWGSWSSPPFSETDTPHVLWSAGATAVTLTPSQPVQTFGFELEPNPFAVFTFTVEFFSGGSLVGSITRDVDGFFGARLFAGTTDEGPIIDSIVITGPVDFAIAQVRYATAPLCLGELSTIVGTSGDDILDGTEGDDVIAGLGGNDVITANGGRDLVCGGGGGDGIDGGSGNDILFGQAGGDLIEGGNGADQLSGAKGNDALNGGPGSDELFGGSDNDALNGQGGSDFCVGDGGTDTAANCEAIQGVP